MQGLRESSFLSPLHTSPRFALHQVLGSMRFPATIPPYQYPINAEKQLHHVVRMELECLGFGEWKRVEMYVRRGRMSLSIRKDERVVKLTVLVLMVISEEEYGFIFVGVEAVGEVVRTLFNMRIRCREGGGSNGD